MRIHSKLPQVILFIGKPLSGKGTQAKLLAEREHYELVKISDIIRHKLESLPQSLVIQRARESYISGAVIDGAVVGPWVREKVQELYNQNKRFILDGSPRTLTEARQLLKQLRGLYQGLEAVAALELQISDVTAFQRAKKRARKLLDQPGILKKRLKEYRQKTAPARDYLDQQGVLVPINGEQSIEEIYNEILDKIQKRA